MTENWQQLSIEKLDPAFSFGKMSSGHSAVTAAKTSKPSSKKSSESSSQMRPICLCLKSGAKQELSWMNVEDLVSLGEPTMLNGTEFHKDGVEFPLWLTLMVHPQGTSYLNLSEKPDKVVESHLRDVLETRVPLTYFLSDTACAGILRRSKTRGKQLPDILDTALKCQIAWYPLAKKYFDERGISLKDAYIDMLSIDTIYAVGFDAYNNSLTGDKAMSMTGAATDAHHIPCVVCFDDVAVTVPVDKLCSWDGGQLSPTLTKQNAGGNQRMPDKDNFNCVLHPFGICSQNSNSMKSSNPHSGIYEADTARTLDGNGGNPTCNQGGMAIVDVWNGKLDGAEGNGIAFSVVGDHDNRPTDMTNAIVYGLDRASFNQGANAKFDFAVEEDLAPTVVAKGPGAVATPTSRVFYAVRRLTPRECEALQGFPDGWTDIGEWVDSKGKKHKMSDAQRYRALGNSLALPFWAWLIDRISAQYDRKPTMCSLFDGISGFPLCWERTNGAGTCLWTSEIEEFPMAVAKKHFGDDDIGLKGDFEKYEKVGK